MEDSFDQQPSKSIKALFDDQIGHVTKNDVVIPFSADTIISDLVQAGIGPLDAIDILFNVRPHLYPKIQTDRIIQLLNQAMQELGYLEGDYLPGSYLQPILIEFPNKERELFNFRIIKGIVRDSLIDFTYSSKTYRSAVDELHRIVKTLRTTIIKLDTIEKMMPAVMRNIIGVNPFSRDRCNDDYSIMINLMKNFHELWHSLPDHEKPNLVRKLFESAFRVILLSYDFLPGNSFSNSIYQIKELVTYLAQTDDKVLSAKEVYIIGKTSKRIHQIYENPETLHKIDEHELIDATEIIMSVVHGLMNRGAIAWIVVTDAVGNELYSKFVGEISTNKSLIAMAMSGVDSIVNEITDSRIKEIQQDEGRTILIEKLEYFSVIALVHQSSHLVRQKIIELTKYIDENLKPEIINFKGSVDVFHDKIGTFISQRMQTLVSA
jgi:hypothetical protein